jgi:tetratricopeptide (TPR) repeat protein
VSYSSVQIPVLVLSVFSAPLMAEQAETPAYVLWQEHMRLGESLEQKGSYLQAKQQFRTGLDALGAGQRDKRSFLSDIHLAATSGQLGQYAEAEEWGNRAMRTGTALYGVDSAELAVPLLNLAIVYRDENRYANAEQASRRVLDLLNASDSHRTVLAATLGLLGTVLFRRGEFREAEQVLRQSVEAAEKLGVSNPEILAENLSNLAAFCRKAGRQAEAGSLFQRALPLYEQAYGPEHPELVPILTAMATLHADSGDYREAIQENEHAVQLAKTAWGPNHPLIHDALLDEASWLRKLHRKHEAKALETEAKAIERATAHNSLVRYTVDARDLATLKSAKARPKQ